MFTRFEANKSTKGASKLRRDLINAEIANLRDLLPLPQSTRQRLSQLQLMALICVYVRKANYFQQVFKRNIDIGMHTAPTPNIGFTKAMSGFLMMLTQNGKLLYISDNAAEYLGHSMEDLLIHGDSVYDIIDKQDHGAIQAELGRGVPQHQTSASHHHHHHGHHSNGTQLDGEHRMFLCRMNVSRNARRQMRFGDQKVILVQGHYLSYLPLCSRNEPVFIATCTPIAMPETRECVVQGATNVFTTIHSMDMKVVHIDRNGEFHLGYSRSELQGISWYNLLHWESTREAQNKHRLITQSEQDRSCILLVRMQRRQNDFIWVHVVLQVRDGQDSNQQSVIVCTNQVLSDREASVMLSNSWLYHYYTVQSKMQFGIPFEGATRIPPNTAYYGGHHSPTHSAGIQSHGYIAPPHHVSYGYHSPVGQSGGGGASTGHNGTSLISHHHGLGGEHYRPYGYRLKTHPVDYSSQQQPPMVSTGQVRCESTGSSQSIPINGERNGSPPAKKRALGRLEPLYIPGNEQDSPESSVIELQPSSHPINHEHPADSSLSRNGSGISGGAGSSSINGSGGLQTMTLSTSLHTRSNRILKAPPSATITSEPTDFIDQWNPSPPWSDTTVQKVPDISHQQLSPYMTTTPPTPTSAPPHVTGIPTTTFSFDWMPEQFVPIMADGSTGVPCTLTQDGIPVPMSLPMPVPLQIPPPPWPSDHRLLPLEGSLSTSSTVERKPLEDHQNQQQQQQFLPQHSLQQHQPSQHLQHQSQLHNQTPTASSSVDIGPSRGIKRSH
ncbi:uncharacterized protein LOC129756201 [Uranotaenia lowii]|uniref:uncharacterized protein LOC129756201 n=1 Tax=Uranotaenia lowii TaxID=190385 RepID=UPI0024794739|nr:uncharacterized protein LOC129756201 [Uranotaenia lowii]